MLNVECEKDIYNLLDRIDIEKGKNYYKNYIEYIDCDEKNDITTHSFLVESERTYDYYNVEVIVKDNHIVDQSCDCPQHNLYGSCKHVAACILNYQDDIYQITKEEKEFQISKYILDEFYRPDKKSDIHLKKQLFLEIELTFNDGYLPSVSMTFKIGEKRLYNLNNKMSRFLSTYEEGEGEVVFGKNFTYDPQIHFFSKEDEQVISYLLSIYKGNRYADFRCFSVSTKLFDSFLTLIKNRKILIVGHGYIDEIKEENPIKFTLSQKDDIYKLEYRSKDYDFLMANGSYIKKDNILYHTPEKVSRIISILKQNRLNKLVFKNEDLDKFSNGILPEVKSNIKLDKTVEDKITIGVKPTAKIYLDLKNALVVANVKFIYNDKEISYFDTDNSIIRDSEYENEVIETMLQYGFIIDKNTIYIDDLDTIGKLLEENLIELAKKYEVFTSDKMKDTKVLKDTKIQSSFSIGHDNTMKYEFDLGSIKNDEIVNVLESLKNKKKYYRLKSGDLLDLENNEELTQLENLMEDMEISNKDLKNGSGTIPKYRAIYLDSVKKDKYDIIKTNNLFDELINNFSSYRDANITLSLKDKKVLRDYQLLGVKWLYNIYKCGFGGILADEMGLGKSIQLIYLIKQILLEKKDAKILIVAPTSLIYNWKNEFDKFASDISYKVLAENKTVRKEELEHLDDYNVLITTYGLVRQDQEKYKEMNFELIAIDEAQNIKNPNAQMTKVVKSLNANTKLALTGTPLENSVLELWSIFDFIMPGYLVNMVNFRKKYNIKNVDDDSLKQLNHLNDQIKPFILRRKKKDVVTELPDKIENNIYIDLNAEQKKLYVAQLEKTQKELDNILSTEGFKKGNFKILQLLTKLRQLCIDPRIVYENYQGGSAKIENLVSIVKEIIENGHKILLFTSYKTALDIVNKEFTNNNISTYVIDGSVSSKKRMELVNKFNEDNTNVFLITLKAGGTGLNLTSADVVIHLDLWWNPQVENQATDRAHRIGQINTVEVIKLICKGTIEERILELQNKKKILSDKLIEGEDRDQNIISQLTEKDIKKLLSIDNEEEE